MGYRHPDEIFNNLDGQHGAVDYFKHIHLFGFLVYALCDKPQYRKPQPNWFLRSTVGVNLGSSREHIYNMPYVINLKSSHILYV